MGQRGPVGRPQVGGLSRANWKKGKEKNGRDSPYADLQGLPDCLWGAEAEKLETGTGKRREEWEGDFLIEVSPE